jgi:hypothetical protein
MPYNPPGLRKCRTRGYVRFSQEERTFCCEDHLAFRNLKVRPLFVTIQNNFIAMRVGSPIEITNFAIGNHAFECLSRDSPNR